MPDTPSVAPVWKRVKRIIEIIEILCRLVKTGIELLEKLKEGNL